jgi:hypothetical protein
MLIYISSLVGQQREIKNKLKTEEKQMNFLEALDNDWSKRAALKGKPGSPAYNFEYGRQRSAFVNQCRSQIASNSNSNSTAHIYR